MERPRRDEQKQEETTEPARTSASRMEEDDWSETGSQWDDDHVTEIFKDSDLYLAAKNGNVHDFKRLLDRVSAAENASFDDIMCRLSPVGNTFLHVSAKHGNVDIVNFIAAKKPSLVLSKNLNGETVLHLAAKAGDVLMVEALLIIHQDLLAADEPDGKNLLDEPDGNNLLRAKNERGNTALHEALFSHRVSIAERLIQEDPELSYYQNKDGESALYLAAKAGFVHFVSLILRLSTDQERVNELFKKKSPIEAAIQGKHKDVLEAIFDINPSVIQLRDDKGRNPLHHAASLGRLEEVRYLLDRHADNATQRNKSGLMPIHLASIEGHVDVVRVLLEDCADPGELLGSHGHNILHLAAKNGRLNIVKFVLKNPDLECLINMKDKLGNTALHLATRHLWPKIVSDLTWDKRVDTKIVNDKGMTARDVSEYYYNLDNPHRYSQWLTWSALATAGTPRYLSFTFTREKDKTRTIARFKEWANFRLVVTTLVATVTFATGFTVPGGYNSSDSGSDKGMATMLREKAFHMFVFCDIVAMYSSIAIALILSWIQIDDYNLTFLAVHLTLPLFSVSLAMMSMAFTSGLFLVVSKLRWLSTAVLVMGITFHFILFLYFLMVLFPQFINVRALRHLSYYPFCFFALLSGRFQK